MESIDQLSMENWNIEGNSWCVNYFVMGICNWEKRKALFVHEMNWPLMSLIEEKSEKINGWKSLNLFNLKGISIGADFLISLNRRRNELLITNIIKINWKFN